LDTKGTHTRVVFWKRAQATDFIAVTIYLFEKNAQAIEFRRLEDIVRSLSDRCLRCWQTEWSTELEGRPMGGRNFLRRQKNVWIRGIEAFRVTLAVLYSSA
jgi:hypothetical protein